MSTDNTTITASIEAKTGGTQSNTTQPSTPQNPSINQLRREAQDGTNDDDDSPPTNVRSMFSLCQNNSSTF
jgi:hypothetical protein